MGSVMLAARTGKPLFATANSANPCWRLNSWDGLMIPKPFSRIVYIVSEPILIPENTANDDMESYRKLLEDRMNIITYQADQYIMNPTRYASPFDVPIPDGYLKEGWDPFTHSINPPRGRKSKKTARDNGKDQNT
jgi:hypothetical protein